MDEIERQRRTDYVRQTRSNNRIDALNTKMELIRRVARMKGEDRVGMWAQNSEERQRQRDEARVEMKLSEKEQQQLTAVEKQIKRAIAEAIATERSFITQVVGKAIAEMLDAERQDAKSELAEETRKLWAVLSEVQRTISALNRAAVAAGGKAIIDLPNPLSSRSH